MTTRFILMSQIKPWRCSHPPAVTNYARLLKSGHRIPPISVIKQKGRFRYRIFDGMHRAPRNEDFRTQDDFGSCHCGRNRGRAMTAPVKITAKAKFDLANEIRSDKTLSLGDRMVGLFLVEKINGNRGVAWPTREQIADGAGVSVPTVKRATKKLDGRYFRITHSNGRGHANEYLPLMGERKKKGIRLTPFNKREKGSSRTEKGSSRARKGVTADPPSLISLTTLNGASRQEKNFKDEFEKASKPATRHKPRSLTRAAYGKKIDEAEAETYLTAFEGLPPEERLTLLKSPTENQKLKLLAHHASKAESRKRAHDLLAQIAG